MMKKALPWLLLTASIAFNIFFVVGMIQARRSQQLVRSPEGRAGLLADKLGMDAAQHAEFLALEKKNFEQRNDFKKTRHEKQKR